MYAGLCLCHESRGDGFLGNGIFSEEFFLLLPFYIYFPGIACKVQAEIIIRVFIGSHIHAEAGVKTGGTAQKREFYMVAELPVVGILRAVFQIHIIQTAYGVKVAASQEDDSILLWRIRFGYLVLCEIK